MSPLRTAAIVCLATACFGGISGASPQALCGPVRSAPDWPRVAVPGSTATVQLPPSYFVDGLVWRARADHVLTVVRRPRLERRAEGIATGPRCRRALADRVVELTDYIEFHDDGRRYITVAVWEEIPGVDVVIKGVASDPKAQGEQIAVIHSLRR